MESLTILKLNVSNLWIQVGPLVNTYRREVLFAPFLSLGSISQPYMEKTWIKLSMNLHRADLCNSSANSSVQGAFNEHLVHIVRWRCGEVFSVALVIVLVNIEVKFVTLRLLVDSIDRSLLGFSFRYIRLASWGRKTTSITVYNCYRSALLSLFFIVIFSKEMTSYKLLSLFLKTDSSYHIYREIAKNELIKLYTIETSTVNRLMELARKTDYLIYIPYLINLHSFCMICFILLYLNVLSHVLEGVICVSR